MYNEGILICLLETFCERIAILLMEISKSPFSSITINSFGNEKTQKDLFLLLHFHKNFLIEIVG